MPRNLLALKETNLLVSEYVIRMDTHGRGEAPPVKAYTTGEMLTEIIKREGRERTETLLEEARETYALLIGDA